MDPSTTSNGIVLFGTGSANEITGNWIRQVGTRGAAGFATYTGVLLFTFETGQLNGNVVAKNYFEISIADLQEGDVSAGVALVAFGRNGYPSGIVGNMILKNDSCGVRTPVYGEPEELLASNLIEKNKVKCYDDDDDSDN